MKKITKEELEKQIFECKTEEDFRRVDDEIIKYAERTGDIPGAHFLWNNLFMLEEGIARENDQIKMEEEMIKYEEELRNKTKKDE